MTWYDELQEDLTLWRRRDWLEDVVVRAGLAHVASWSEVDRILQALTKKPWDLSDWITVDELIAGIPSRAHARTRVVQVYESPGENSCRVRTEVRSG